MIQLTPEKLANCLEIPLARAAVWAGVFQRVFQACEINTVPRAAGFLAQVGHESARLRYVREIWGPTPVQRRYEGRADLGNVQPGDGKRYMGRGLIQVTGRINYAACGQALGLPLLERPELLEQPEHAAMSAGWYWKSRNLNRFCDAMDIVSLTRAVNGGVNGLADRRAIWERSLRVLAGQ